MRPRLDQNFGIGAVRDQSAQDTSHRAFVLGARVQLAVGERAGAALAEAVVGVGIERAALRQRRQIVTARLHRLADVDERHARAGVGQPERREGARTARCRRRRRARRRARAPAAAAPPRRSSVGVASAGQTATSSRKPIGWPLRASSERRTTVTRTASARSRRRAPRARRPPPPARRAARRSRGRAAASRAYAVSQASSDLPCAIQFAPFPRLCPLSCVAKFAEQWFEPASQVLILPHAETCQKSGTSRANSHATRAEVRERREDS